MLAHKIEKALVEHGYTDCFYVGGQLWGFHNSDAIPTPVPSHIIIDAYERRNFSDRENSVKFTRQQRAKLWCDRLLHNIGTRSAIKVAGVKLPKGKAVVLGINQITHSDHPGYTYPLSGSVACKWALEYGELERTSVDYEDVYHLIGHEDEAVIWTCEHLSWARENIPVEVANVWIIGRCDRETSEFMTRRTGLPSQYFSLQIPISAYLYL